MKFDTPKNSDQVRAFYDLCSFYRNFIFRFSELAAPLQHLLQKNQTFVWNDECEQALRTLKLLSTSEPILAYPDFSKEFILATDASNYALGAILGQIQNGHEHVIAYASRLMNSREQKYSITEKEALAVLFATEKFNKYLISKKFKLIVNLNC